LVRCKASPGYLTHDAQAVLGRRLADLECRPQPLRAGYLRSERSAAPEDRRAGEHLTWGSPTDIREDEALPLGERCPEFPLAEVSCRCLAMGESLGDRLIGQSGVRRG
jgi:hypothetical protein